MNPSRLTLARRRRGLTKKQLAELSGVSPRSVTAYEAGTQEPTEQTRLALARELRFPPRFFYLDDLEEAPEAGVSFRALSKMTAGQRDAALAAGAIAIALTRWLEARFNLPDPSVMDLGGIEPSAAAEAVRVEWGLGNQPVSNMVHLLESRGIRVYSLVEDCREVDAFSFWDRATPFIFLNTQKSVERSRFDAAHELAHLIIHQHGAPIGREAEDQANAFAGAFLMPEADFLAHARRHATLNSVIEKKRRWGVSAMAYVHRLYRVSMITDWHYHQLCRTMAGRGYRTREPNPIRRRETSQLLQKVLKRLRETGLGRSQIAEELAIYPQELGSLVFGLVMTGIQGGGGGSGSPSPGLKLVSDKGAS